MEETKSLIPLLIPVPPAPMLEQALGYTGPARCFATWWEPAGDEAMLSDGVTTATGQWQAFLTYTEHPVISPVLNPYDLGSSEAPAKFWLVIDRQDRKAWVAEAEFARGFLRQQWPEDDLRMDAIGMENLIASMELWLSKVHEVTVEEVLHWMEANQRAVGMLQAWLDTQAK